MLRWCLSIAAAVRVLVLIRRLLTVSASSIAAAATAVLLRLGSAGAVATDLAGELI